jgi:hypothetical protein
MKNMKISTVLPAVAVSAMLFLSSCSQQAPKATGSGTTIKAKTTEAVYFCPMDTDVKSDKPGVCPKCGMDLEKIKK